MELGNFTFEIRPKGLDYDQFAIDGDRPIIVFKNDPEIYNWVGEVSKIRLENSTILAFAKEGKAVWSGQVRDLGIIKEGDTIVFDFNPILSAYGVNIPSTRFPKITKKQPAKDETPIEALEEVQDTNTLVVEEVESVEEPKVEEEPKKEIMLNGIRLTIKS